MRSVKGVLYLVLAGVMCSIGGVCIRLTAWQPLAVNGGRGLVAACVTGLFLLYLRHRLTINASVVMGAVSLALTMNLYVLSVRLTTAANAILLMYTSPFFVMLYLWIFYKKRPTVRGGIAAMLVLGGLALLVAGSANTGGSLLGDALGLASGAAYAGVFLVNAGADGDAFSSCFFGQLLAGIIGLPALLCERDFSLQPIVCILLLGVVQLGISYIFMAKGVCLSSPFTASLVTCIEPVLSPVWVALLCGETMAGTALIGGALVLCSVVLGSLPPKVGKARKQKLQHNAQNANSNL